MSLGERVDLGLGEEHHRSDVHGVSAQSWRESEQGRKMRRSWKSGREETGERVEKARKERRQDAPSLDELFLKQVEFC